MGLESQVFCWVGGGILCFLIILKAVQVLWWRELRQAADTQRSDAGLAPFLSDVMEEQIAALLNEEIINRN